MRANFFPVAFLLAASKTPPAKLGGWSFGTRPGDSGVAGWGGGGGGYKIKMRPKFLASPVLLAFVLDPLTPLS